ncbi:MAG: hypothetical protein B7Z80_19760 [Rhodospirillales bacterium 20-64-7]|nr:MAG: hypothetical protein B7Z80_19760 [Rhodospirillales bacterium 20-64-7]HQT80290.1 hypothetical protein [Rhodopila sp.]
MSVTVRNSWMFRKAVFGIAAALLSFVVLSIVAALWPNPFFIRMVPAKKYEIPLLAAQSTLLGLYVTIRRPYCGIQGMSMSSVVNFFGVACPICNKVFLLIFGATALLTYFEPVRFYVGLGGLGLGGLGLAVLAVATEARAGWLGPLAPEQNAPTVSR